MNTSRRRHRKGAAPAIDVELDENLGVLELQHGFERPF